MTKDHWKPKLLFSLLPFLFFSGSLLPKECHGQTGDNGNFFYYYSPTQRTQVQHGFPSGTGQFFNNPFFNQQTQQQAQMQGTQPVEQSQQQQQQPQQNLGFPSFQQSSLLGFNHPNFQQQQQPQQVSTFPSAPSGRLQFPVITPTPVAQQQQQHQLPQQTSPSFSHVTNFGPSAQFFGSRHAPIPQPSQSPFFSTQSPLGTVAPGAFNFFQSPFQYLQQRYMEDASPTPIQPTSAPGQPAEFPTVHTPTSTVAPPRRPTPTPAVEADSRSVEQVVERRGPKFSSRFRYVEQPQVHQYNPYTRIGSPYTSDLPYTEQRFYSSPTTPTGYAFSLGGDKEGAGATSTVHFSMGPVNKINQYLTEVTETRKRLQNQIKEQSSTPVQAVLVSSSEPRKEMPVEEAMSQDAPSSPEPTMSTTTVPSSTTTTPTPVSSSPEPMPAVEVVPVQATVESTNTTSDPLLKESSFHTETVAELVVPDEEVPTGRKASETSIPKRLVIRKKVARKRLRLDGSGEIVDAPMPPGVMIRRIASPNRLPTEDPKQFEDDISKGFAITPSTTTTTAPEQFGQLPGIMTDVHANQDRHEMPVESHPAEEDAHISMGEIYMPQQPMSSLEHLSSTKTAPETPNVAPEEIQPSVQMVSSTTSAPIIQPLPVEALMSQERIPDNKPTHIQQSNKQGEEYYEDYYEEEVPSSQAHPHSVISTSKGSSRIMTAVMAPESEQELPLLDGVQKDDYPGVFRKHSSPQDNSVETEQGEIITRITSSHPSESAEQQAISLPPAQSSPMTISTTTTEQSQPEFMREDPEEEHPPMDSEEPAMPVFQPTTEVAAPMMTTTPSPRMSSTTPEDGSPENSSQEQISAEDELPSAPMSPQEAHIDSASSTTEQAEGQMEQIAGATMSSSTEANPQQDQAEMHEEAEMPALVNDPSASSTMQSIISNNANEDSALMSEMEVANPSSSTESLPTENEEIVSVSSTTTVAPPSGTTEDESKKSMDDVASHSEDILEENMEDHRDEPKSQEQVLDSEEIGKVQRLALEDTLKRLRERQQTSSTSDPQEDNSPENEIQPGKRVFMRRPLQLNNLPLPTTGPAVQINAALEDAEGADRSQVVEKIQRFRAKYGRGSSTTTKRPRRVTRPSSSTERRLAVVSRVEDLVGNQEQVDSFSDSSSTPGAVEQIYTTSAYTTSRPYRTTTMMTSTTPSTTTTMIPSDDSPSSSTTTAPIFEEEMAYPTYSTTSTEAYNYAQQTTTHYPTLTRMTESTAQSMDEFSSTTETDFETITERMQGGKSTMTTTTTEPTMMMTTTPPAAMMERATTPSTMTTTTTTTTTTTESTMTDFSDDNKDTPKNDYDVYYSEDENVEAAKNIQVSSSSETSIVASDDDLAATPSSTTTIPPLSSSTDTSVYSYMTTTSDPNSAATTTLSSTTMVPDLSSMMTTATTSAGQLIIHEILPTMPPLKEVSFVIGESVEDDQSSAAKADISDELLAADKAIVRVETNVHVSTNVTTDLASEEQYSIEELTQSQEQQPLNSTMNASGGSGQRRVRVVVRRQRRLRRPSGEAASGPGGEGRRRRRKVLYRRPQ